MSGVEAQILTSLSAEAARFQPLLDQYGLWALATSNLAEGIGLPLPGQTLLIACALLAAKGGPDIFGVLLVAWWATWIGDLVGYLVGRRGLSGWLYRSAAASERLAGIQVQFARWGFGLLEVARFFDGLRQTSNIAAGALQMPCPRFLAGTAVGTTLWVGAFGLGVYALDRDRQAVLAALHGLRVWGWAAAAGLAAFAVYRGRRRRG
jgi:membrane protein DedA with SNARE-associated domain